MQELIKIDSAPAKLGANFDEVKARLKSELSKYDVLVTVETLPDAKKLATELNQTAKAIDDRRKQEVAAVSAPIKAFDDQMKELVTMCKDGRQKLTDQIQRYEDETREKVRALLAELRSELWSLHGVEQEFQSAKFDDLVILTSITKAGNLAAKASSELESRVLADKSLQDRTRMRLLELENASYKAGLSAPLTRDHVAGFLMTDEITYTTELGRIFAAEILREKEAQRRMREKLEREQQEKAEREQAERERIEREQQERDAANATLREDSAAIAHDSLVSMMRQEDIEHAPFDEFTPSPEGEPEPSSVDMTEEAEDPAPQTAKVRVTVLATFQPEVPVNASDEQIEAALRRAMDRAGITSLVGIEVVHPEFLEAAE